MFEATPRSVFAVLALCAVVWSPGCGGDPSEQAPTAPLHPEGTQPAGTPQTPALPPLEVDFGVIRHGDKPSKKLELSFGRSVAGYRLAGFSSGCSCARPSFRITDRSGVESDLPAHGFQKRVLSDDDQLWLVLSLDTSVLEVIDQQVDLKTGRVVLARGDYNEEQLTLPVLYRYAVDAPVAVLPVAHLNVERLPRSREYTDTLRLRFDEEFAGARPLEALTTFPGLSARLGRASDAGQANEHVVHIELASVQDTPPGPFLTHIDIPTEGAEGYNIRIPVSGEIVEDIVVQPMPHISFGRIDFGKPRQEYLNLTDHKLDREPGFEVARISEFAEHFDVRLEPIPGDPRSQRLFVDYLGTLSPASAPGGTMRGQIYLRKPGEEAICQVITFVAFHQPKRP